MELYNLVKNDNIDGLRDYFLRSAFQFCFDREIGKAYEFIKLGLEFTICDCTVSLLCRHEKSFLLEAIDSSKGSEKERSFCRVVILLFLFPQNENALNDANNIVNQLPEDKYVLFIKGRICQKLKQFREACDYFNASELECSTYWQARIELQEFDQAEYIASIYRLYVNNPRSTCCYNQLKKYTIKQGIEAKNRLIYNNRDNLIIKDFFIERKIDENFWNTDHVLTYLFNDKYRRKVVLSRAPEPEFVISEFVSFLKLNESIFVYRDRFDDPRDYHSDNGPDYDRMYFDAMSDGQLGDYDDFDGSSDWIDDWSGR